jgi:hypothetical protein
MWVTRAVLCAVALISCASTDREEQYIFRFRGELEDTVTVRRNGAGKVIVALRVSGNGVYYIEPDTCPPHTRVGGQHWVTRDLEEAVIEGSALTSFLSVYGRSNSEPSIRPRFIIKRTMIVALRLGRVMYQIFHHRPAPSTAAASYSSGLMLVIAAR